MKPKDVKRKYLNKSSELKEILKEWLYLREITKLNSDNQNFSICKRYRIFLFIYKGYTSLMLDQFF